LWEREISFPATSHAPRRKLRHTRRTKMLDSQWNFATILWCRGMSEKPKTSNRRFRTVGEGHRLTVRRGKTSRFELYSPRSDRVRQCLSLPVGFRSRCSVTVPTGTKKTSANTSVLPRHESWNNHAGTLRAMRLFRRNPGHKPKDTEFTQNPTYTNINSRKVRFDASGPVPLVVQKAMTVTT